MSDVELSSSVNSSGVARGMAEIRNYVKEGTSEIGGNFAKAFAAGSVIEMGRRLLETSEHLEHLSEKFGLSTKVLQQWGNAAELVGSSSDSVAAALNKLEIARSKALGGNEGLTKSFAQLNVSFEDLEKDSPDELLKKIGSSSLNAADLVKILGRSALDLRPLLEGVANGSIQLGQAMDESTVRQLAAANRQFKEFGQTIEIFLSNVLGNFIKVWQTVVTNVTAGVAAINAAAHGNFSQAGAYIQGGKAAAHDIWNPEEEPERHPNLVGGGDAGETDDFGNPTGKGRGAGGGGGSSGGSARLKQLQDQHIAALEKLKSSQEQLNNLTKERQELLANSAKTNVTEEGTLETNIKLAENQLAIDRASKAVADETEDAKSKAAEAAEKAREEAEKEATERQAAVDTAVEANAELQQQLAGHADIAEQMRIEFDYAQKIRQAEEDGNTELAKQLEIERDLTLEAKAQEAAAKEQAKAEAEADRAQDARDKAGQDAINNLSKFSPEDLLKIAAANPLNQLKDKYGPDFGTHGPAGGPNFQESLIIDNYNRQQEAAQRARNQAAELATHSLPRHVVNGRTYYGDSYPGSASFAEILAELRQIRITNESIEKKTDPLG